MTTDVFEDLLRHMQGLMGRRVEVEIGSRAPIAGRPVVAGSETVHAAFSGVLSRAPAQGEMLVFHVGDGDAGGRLYLSPTMHFSGYWRERNFRQVLEIMSMQPVLIWVTPLPDER